MDVCRNSRRPLRLLVIEDREDDVQLLVDHLERSGFSTDWRRVQSEAELVAALVQPWDLILSDYSMPGFNGIRALSLVRTRDPDVPLIFVSGTIGEGTAVEAMRNGAQDYVMKGNLARLVPAIERELREVRERRERRQTARERARLVAILEATPDLVAIVAPDGMLDYLNTAGRRLLGLGALAELEGRCLRDIFPEHVAEHLLAEAFPTACRDGFWSGETAMRPPDAVADIPFSQVVLAHRGADGNVDYLSTVARDISERKRLEVELQYQATHDRLTGLPNRFLLTDRLGAELAHVRRHGGHAAVMFLDLDNFKRVNDSLGHAAGDVLLQQVAARLQGCLRPTDTVARHGGDEFTVAIGDLSRVEDVLAVLRKIRAAFERPLYAGSQEVFATFSIGIALFPHDGAGVEDLLRNADTAMYRAKAGGRNQYRFYAPDMNARGHELLALEVDLRRALELEQFQLFYQPQVDLRTGTLVALEALIRWRHPERGLVSPAEFLPLLEDTGLILPVGEWVFRRACADARVWCQSAPHPLRVSVNVSALQFTDPRLPTTVRRILAEERMPAGSLEIEITENLMMRDPVLAGETLRALQALGVSVAIDDFGIGYSSLSYLKNFPLDVLKIDRTFIRDLGADAGDATIVEASISLGHKLGLAVVAEGVETQAQLDFLRASGCDRAQGYWLGRPQPVEEIARLLAR